MPSILLPDETYQKLARRAEALDTTVEAIVEEIVPQEKVPALHDPVTWHEQYEAMLAGIRSRARRYPPGFEVDIRREAMSEDPSE
jgi:hypothetical protein